MPYSILLVGDWKYSWYQEACSKALQILGHQVVKYGWSDLVKVGLGNNLVNNLRGKFYIEFSHLQNRLLWGPELVGINLKLVKTAISVQPQVIWLYNCTHIFPRTVRLLREQLPQTVFVQYANDNPFGRHIKPDYWRHFKKSIPYFDVHFVYRKSNEEEFLKAGANSAHLLRSYFLPEEDYRVPLEPGNAMYNCDVAFVGHYEPDNRVELLEAVAESGVRLNIFGGNWADCKFNPLSPLRASLPIHPVLGQNYRLAISGAKIALCFLSKLNRDTYTRRNFQIPAMGTFILSEYTEDLASLFTEGLEAEYFRSKEELLSKIQFYLRNDKARERIAQKGHERVWRDGHDVINRMKYFLEVIDRESK